MGASSSKKKYSGASDLLDGFAESAASIVTQEEGSIAKELLQTRSVEESAKRVTELVNESTASGITTSCKETGQKINSLSRSTVDSVNNAAQQVGKEISTSSTTLIADIHKTTSNLHNKAVTDAKETVGSAFVVDNTDHRENNKLFDVLNDCQKSLPKNVIGETAKNIETKLGTDVVKKTVQELNNLSGSAIQQELALTLTTANAALREIVHDSSDAISDTVQGGKGIASDILKKSVDEIRFPANSAIQQELAVTLTTANAALREIVHDSSDAISDTVQGGKGIASEILEKSVDEIRFPANSAIQQELAVTLTTANAALREIIHDTVDPAFKVTRDAKNIESDILKESVVGEISFPTNSVIQQELAVTLTTASAALKEIVHDTPCKAVTDMGGCATKGSADISQGITCNDNIVSEVSGKIVTARDQGRGAGDQNHSNENNMPEIVEAVVCQETDLKNGEMKEFNLGDAGDVLLVKNDDGRFSALGTKCTHYGASMVNGILYKGGIRCPYHGACFNSTTGDIEESPGLDSLPCYKVSIENGQVKVAAPKDLLKINKRIKDTTCTRLYQDPRVFVVIGGGGAAQSWAETLRIEGFQGRIIMLTAEDVRPYDRPKLSKAMNSTPSEITLRNEVFYQNSDIEIWLNHEANSVDVRKRVVKCKNGASLNYSKLLIATGGKPRTLDIPGSNLKNISYLRTPEESNCIMENGKGKNVVIYGSSFIGMEVAAFMKNHASSVTIVARSAVPFVAVFGEDIGHRYKRFFESEGIVFETGAEVAEFRGTNGRVSQVVLKNGKTLAADVVVIGIGVSPATNFLGDSGIQMTSDGLVPVNEYLKTSVDDVFAAGDIAEFPLIQYDNRRAHVAHWQIAQCHGRNAARNMLGKHERLLTVPFFWCVVLGKGIRYAGYCEDHDSIVMQGNLEEMNFAAYFCKGEDVRAVVSMGLLTAVNYAHFVQHGKHLTKADLEKYPDNGWFKPLS